MPGLGSARQHPVDRALLDYEHIEGLEFIELNPDLPCPRSVAYRATEAGADLRVRSNTPQVHDVSVAQEQARGYIEALAASGLFSWQRVYRPAQGTFTLAAVQWRLKVSFRGGKIVRPRPFEVEGEGLFPDDYEHVLTLLFSLAPAQQLAAPDVSAVSDGLAASDGIVAPDEPGDTCGLDARTASSESE